MLTFVKQFFSPPPFEDSNEIRIAGLLNISLLVLLIAAILVPIAIIVAQPVSTMPALLLGLAPGAILLGAFILMRYLLYRHRIQGASIVLSFTLLIATSVAVYNSNQGIQSPSVSGFIVVIILSSLYSRGRYTVFFFTGLALLVTLTFFLLEARGLIEVSQSLPPLFSWGVYGVVFILTGVLLSAAIRRLNGALERAEQSEASLRELAGSLEKRILERTRALETSVEVSRRLSTYLDLEQLASEVVEEVKQAFNYYHAHIYLLDEPKAHLVMVAGTGEVGKAMLAIGHKLSIHQGLVGRAARLRETVLVPDVFQEPAWVPNDMLPATKAEIAVPIISGNALLGVLDVQHNVPHSLGEGDKILLEGITNQVAIAFENARLYRQAQQKAEREALINAIGQKIQAANDVEAILQLTARELGQALDVQSAMVQIG